MSPSSQISQIRQRIAQLARQRQAAEKVLLERAPLLKGSLVEVRRTCGNPRCKCARGEKHLCRQLSASVQGKTRTWNVPRQYAAKVKQLTESYRRFRQTRASCVRMSERMLRLIDELEAARIVTEFRDEPRRQKSQEAT